MRRRAWVGAAPAAAALVLAGPAGAATAVSVYDANCALCHQNAGSGVPGQAPKLSGRVAQIAADARGRAYLGRLLLTGMSGKIIVDDMPLIGVMPSFAQLSDNDIAAVLNYLAALPPAGKAKPAKFTAAEVKALRLKPVAVEEITAERRRLTDARVIP